MLDLKSQLQKVWITRPEKREILENEIPTGEFYDYFSKPKKYKLNISVRAGTPLIIQAGAVLDYEREIATLKNIDIKEGDLLFIDVKPEIDENGELVLQDDNVTPVTQPDYIVVTVLKTEKVSAIRYGIKKRV